MRFYIAARYSRREEASEVAGILREAGHIITSTWINQVEDEMLYTEGPKVAGKFARKDIKEIRAADALVYLAEEPDNVWGRGGRHVEFGVALALRKDILVMGPQENLFHYLNEVKHCDNVEDLLAYIKETYG